MLLTMLVYLFPSPKQYGNDCYFYWADRARYQDALHPDKSGFVMNSI